MHPGLGVGNGENPGVENFFHAGPFGLTSNNLGGKLSGEIRSLGGEIRAWAEGFGPVVGGERTVLVGAPTLGGGFPASVGRARVALEEEEETTEPESGIALAGGIFGTSAEEEITLRGRGFLILLLFLFLEGDGGRVASGKRAFAEGRAGGGDLTTFANEPFGRAGRVGMVAGEGPTEMRWTMGWEGGTGMQRQESPSHLNRWTRDDPHDRG
ncbi:DgyrCDS14079 [Dimorphilus gyrociliatus]|uniref:DgyrCDS14079 n=1 Tax=Dimorphilus gyrociliatus TaxID=2664684 RepID=A0A7I8WCS5_9ANNE|nr:DgyrCDS14079 [Dimorphilus gyrociliatus]